MSTVSSFTHSFSRTNTVRDTDSRVKSARSSQHLRCPPVYRPLLRPREAHVLRYHTSEGTLSSRPPRCALCIPEPRYSNPSFQIYATPPLHTSRTAVTPPAVDSPHLMRSIQFPLNVRDLDDANAQFDARHSKWRLLAGAPYQHHFYAGPQPFLHPQYQYQQRAHAGRW
ncbi:hypothetical protein C8R44DRAFT_895056 [Mycena epipterygia]|nr:hypothetical protein C8R44DRAFT_895056 [Mycena epipterygia]